jgi:hypothetical protein
LTLRPAYVKYGLSTFGLLAKPALYLSDFFERHKGEYYDQFDGGARHEQAPAVALVLPARRA